MGQGVFQPLEVNTSGPNGAAVNVSRLDRITVQVKGTFSATLGIEVSHDGANFSQLGANITGPEVREITGTWLSLRIATSVYTSGAPEATLGGRDTRTR